MFGQDVVIEFSALVGFAALVTVIVNILKHFKVIQDGSATAWVSGFNLVGLIGLLVYRFFKPEAPIGGVDNTLATIANILSYVLAFIVQLGISKAAHVAVKGTPVIGTSYTLMRTKAKQFIK